MQAQEERDGKTITIATALVLFVLVLGVGGLAVWVANSAFDVADEINAGFAVVIWSAAAVIPIVFLARSVRR